MNKHIVLLEFSYSLYAILVIVISPILIVYSVIRSLYRFLKSRSAIEKSIAGEVALITGSGRGLGRAIAITLAKRGCHIAIVDIQGDLAEQTAEDIAQTYGVKTKAYKIDVSNYEQLLDLKRNVTHDLGHVTILINNAGIMTLSSFDTPSPQEIHRMVNVNYTAMIYTTQIFLPKMKELNRGHIVNISSITAFVPCNFYMIYAGTKAAVRQLTSSLRIDLMQSGTNITATTVMPTFVWCNGRIEQLMRKVGADVVVAGTSFDVVAQYTVKAMLCGDDEVSVPRSILYSDRLISLFTKYFTEKVIAIGTKSIWKKRNNDDIKDLLKSDIPTDC